MKKYINASNMKAALNLRLKNDMEKHHCIYCDKLKNKSDFSLEHIFPESLGGNLLNQLFKTRSVCQTCNNLMGLYVDGAYIKSHFVRSQMSIETLRYINLDEKKACPLIYMGILGGLNLPDGSICELWLSPCRGRILHIHSNHDDEFYGYIGGDPRSAKKSPGLAIFINASDKNDWIILGLRSFAKHFKKSERIVANVTFSSDENYISIGGKPNSFHQKIIDDFLSYGDSIRCELSTDITYCERFMGKLGLGLGYQLGGNDYLQTDYAKKLRDFLWEKDPTIRSKKNILFEHVWPTRKTPFEHFFEWEGGIIIAILIAADYLVLKVTIYGNNHSIVISRDRKIIQKCADQIGDGIIFLLIPHLDECVGPIPMHDYILHKTSSKTIPALMLLESRRISSEDLVKTR